MVVSRSHVHPDVTTVAERLGIADVRPCGSVGLKVALVATGRCDGYVDFNRKTKEWDTCAAQAIVEACGGVMTDLFGESLTCNRPDVYNRSGLIAASQEIHRAILPPAAAVASRAFGNG
jgi:3'(2'), 5'-bisphosphate nucleotidase